MAQNNSSTAVGAGTTAGDAADQERETTSRAAEAVEDAQLESIRTTGAAPKGTAGTPPGMGGRSESDQPPPVLGASPGGARPARHSYSERPRKELAHNKAGIGSRLDDPERERPKSP